MDLQLTGKSALVSGSTAGIGLAIATSLAREGAHVIVNGRTQKRVDEALATIKETVPIATVRGIALDLGTAGGVAAIVEQLPAVDILINNLGIFDPKPFEQVPDEEWMRFFEVNVMSGVRLSRAYLPGMRAKNWGRVIFISSESALNVPTEMIHYGMTKTAQVSIARGLAQSLAGTNVTVNSVLPGPTWSEGVEQMVKGQPRDVVTNEFFEKVRPTSIIKRFIETEEVASTVTYLCSPLAAATTGAAIRVEGGVVQSI